MIVVDQEGFSTRNYRKFNIRYDNPEYKNSLSDDYYMVKEVISRRFKQLNINSDKILPDVIIIDGGKGHLNIVKKHIIKNNLTSIKILGVSKGKNRNSGNEILHTLNDNKVLREAFGDHTIDSYIKLKKEELSSFHKEEIFDKKSSVTNWEKQNTLDC